MRTARTLAIAALALPTALFAQTSAPAPGNTPPQQKCIVEGHVFDAQTGEPLKKVSVHLVRYAASNRRNAQAYSDTSNADGSFRFESVEPGDYVLSGSRTGFLPTQYGAKSPNARGTSIHLGPGQRMTEIVLKLVPQAVISGRLVDEDGDPVANAYVVALKRTWIRGKLRYLPQGSSSTNDLGDFRVGNLSAGKYYVMAQIRDTEADDDPHPAPGRPDIRDLNTCYPNAPSIDAAMPVQVSAGQETPGIEIRVRRGPTYHVRGKLTGSIPDGGVESVTVRVQERDDTSMGFMGNPDVKKDGTFDIAGVGAGSYMIIATTFRHGFETLASEPVEISSADVNNVVLNILPPVSLSGQIRIEGTPPPNTAQTTAARVRVLLAPIEMMRMARFRVATAKSDGTFTIEDLEAAMYYPVISQAPTGTYLKSVQLGNQDVLGKELDLSQGSPGSLDIVFAYGAAEIDGTARKGDDPVVSASIVLIPDVLRDDGSGLYFATTDQSGSFVIKEIAPGHYRAYAFEHIDTSVLQDPELVRAIANEGTDLEIKENDHKQIQLSVIPQDNLNQILARFGLDSQ